MRRGTPIASRLESGWLPGLPVTWTIVVTGGTLAGATGVMTSDTVPMAVAGVAVGGPDGGACMVSGQVVTCNFGTIGYHEGKSYTITGTLASSFTGDLVNTATAMTTSMDSNTANNTSTSTVKTAPRADLSVQKSDGLTTAKPGHLVTYTIVVSNPGPSDEPSAMVNDPLPAALLSASWTCTPTGGASCTSGPVSGNVVDTVSLPAGSSVTYTITGRIDIRFAGTLSNTATVTSSVIDPSSANNSVTDQTDVPPLPPAGAPALGPWGLSLAIVLLMVVAGLAMRRSRVRGADSLNRL